MPRRREPPSTPPRGAALLDSMDCPAWLNRDGKRQWWDMAPSIAELHGGLTPRLADLIGRYIAAIQQADAAGRAIQKRRGEICRQTRKGPKVWPEFAIEAKARRTLLFIGDQIGCSPRARMKILARRQPHRPRNRPA